MVVGLGEELDPAPIIQICAQSGLCCHALVDVQNAGSAPIEDGYTTLLDPLANALSAVDADGICSLTQRPGRLPGWASALIR